MARADLYSEALKDRVHELYTVADKPMREVQTILQTEFPGEAKRLTLDRLRSIATHKRNKINRQLKATKRAKGVVTMHTVKPVTKKDGRVGRSNALYRDNEQQILEICRNLRETEGWRWNAIKQHLSQEFPLYRIPHWSTLAKKIGTTGCKHNDKTVITITTSNKAVITIEVTPKLAKRVLDYLISGNLN